MKPTKLEIGGVYKTEWDDRLHRIIGLDDVEVFYDVAGYDRPWSLSGNLKKKCSFYRTSAALFEMKSSQIDLLPLTEEEYHFFRPDLPMRIGRTKKLDWNQIDFKSYADFLNSFDADLITELGNQQLQTNTLIILPYGPAGGRKKGEKLVADNGNYFSAAELIWKSKQIQESVNKSVSIGIGIYRIGTEKGIPSYYIGFYLDSAGLLTE